MAEPSPARQGANVAEFTVSELSGAIKRALEDGFQHVRLRGEISGYRGPHASGHCYFALKDEKAKIEAVIWRAVFQRLRVKPTEGLEVVATGRITSYPGSSKYQIVVETLEPAGVGALMALLEERKKKLTAEGLFAAERKRQLPFLPSLVGIVTSPTGAVIRDMLAGFGERFPTHVVVWPVRVQGETSAAEVAAAIRGFNAMTGTGSLRRPDVLIVARGGGSLEDLWGFNDEAVVRAAAESAIPVISAVGHETDWTLIDLAADARAPTPTKAAEWAVPKHSELLAEVADYRGRLAIATRRRLEKARADLKGAARGLPRLADLVELPRQRLDNAATRLGLALKATIARRRSRLVEVRSRLPDARQLLVMPRQRLGVAGQRLGRALLANTRAHATRHARLAARLQPRLLLSRIERARERLADRTARCDRAIGSRLQSHRRRLESARQMLQSLGYQSVLRRGFALVRDGDGKAIRQAATFVPGARIDIEVADGRVGATVDGTTDTGLATGRVAPRPAGTSRPRSDRLSRATPRRGGGGQGSLF